MRDCGIEEGHTATINKEDLVAAIKRVHGAEPFIFCRRPLPRPPLGPVGNKQQWEALPNNIFKEVFLCFDLSLNPVDCEPGDLR